MFLQHLKKKKQHLLWRTLVYYQLVICTFPTFIASLSITDSTLRAVLAARGSRLLYVLNIVHEALLWMHRNIKFSGSIWVCLQSERVNIFSNRECEIPRQSSIIALMYLVNKTSHWLLTFFPTNRLKQRNRCPSSLFTAHNTAAGTC